MIRHRPAIDALGAAVLLVAYDEPGLLAAKVMRGVDAPFPLLLDRSKAAYAAWGMGRARRRDAMLSPRLTWRYLKLLLRGERFLGFAPDMLQLGGDFVVAPDGAIAFAHRMRDNGDRAPTERLLEALEVAASPGRAP